jgi:hypothetical protein
VKFLSAFEEKDHPIAQANAPIDEASQYINPTVTSRVAGEFMMVERDKIELMDISPNQLVSVSASLIPFLENDDANRALMGSNMQRQAVPLIKSEAPWWEPASKGWWPRIPEWRSLPAGTAKWSMWMRPESCCGTIHPRPVPTSKLPSITCTNLSVPIRIPVSISGPSSRKANSSSRRDHCRRPCHRAGGTRPGEKCHRGLHALGGIQFRGLYPRQRTVG